MSVISRDEKVKYFCGRIYESMRGIGESIQNAKDRTEADNLHSIVLNEHGHRFAQKIWDYYVDWEKVEWE